jgi:hypothetical protein
MRIPPEARVIRREFGGFGRSKNQKGKTAVPNCSQIVFSGYHTIY